MKWTDKQLDVINTRGRNILVSAAAGSGKTAVLVERIIQLITDDNADVNIDELLVVTFTRAAASEMKERIREALEVLSRREPENENVMKQLALIHNASISTIDSFCATVVRENFDRIDLDPNFRIADETEIEMLKMDVMDQLLEEYYLNADESFMNLAKQYSTGKLSDNIGEAICQLYQHANGHSNPEKWVQKCADIYHISDADMFEQSEFMQQLLVIAKREISGILDNLNMALEISEESDGPGCGDALKRLIEDIKIVKDSSNYNKMRLAFRGVKSVTLRGVKGCDEVKKKLVQDIKKKAMEKLSKMESALFSQTIEDMVGDIQNSRESVDMLVMLTLDFMKRFAKEKADKGIMDFNDQAHFALNILVEEDSEGNIFPSEVAKEMSHKFKEIMIDEYQDSNYVQEDILTSVSGGQGINNIFMVGDVKQSIYRFRQAEPKLFLEKYKTYSSDLTNDNCKIVLDKNFRSRREIIDSVNYIFEYIMNEKVGGIDYKRGNGLEYGADFGELSDGQDNSTEVILVEGDDRKAEADFVAKKILEITDPLNGLRITEKGQGERIAKYSDITILLRSVKGISEIYMEQLEENGIPSFSDSRTGYYQTMEVRTVMSALSIIDNPRQDIPLAAVLVSPMFSFTEEELAVIRTENICENLYENLVMYQKNGEDKGLLKKVDDFLTILNRFRDSVPYTSVYDLINQMLEETGYDYYITAMPNGRRRHLNIEALKEKAVAYENISYKGLFHFVRYIEKLQYLDSDDGEASVNNENDNIVRIMSIHKSKGLQFPVVFLCDTNGGTKHDTDKIVVDGDGNIGVDFIDGTLKVKSPTIIKTLIKKENKKEDMAERLRILYVALTRAKEKLYITGFSKDINKTVGEFYSSIYDKGTEMSYMDIVDAPNMMTWIGKAVGKNKAFTNVAERFIGSHDCSNTMYDRNSNIVVDVITREDMVYEEMRESISGEIQQETIDMLIASQKSESEEKMIEKRFSFQYPYLEDVTLHSKASVTEIKKQSMEYEEEIDGFYQFEAPREVTEIIPDFAKSQENTDKKLYGAERGTAYHRVFELLDFDLEEYNQESVSALISAYVEKGFMTKEQKECISYKDIIQFTKSNLFYRMKKAKKAGKLFRERKFLLGVKAGEINQQSNSEETMIVQGIIDVCFEEDGEFVIVDYKTDKVGTMKELVDRYRVQLECYKLAIERISKIHVKEMIIYSVTLGDELEINDRGEVQ